MSAAALADLRRELLATHHIGRISRMLALGRAAKAGGEGGTSALELIDTMSAGDVYERRLVLYALQVAGDAQRLLSFTEDEAESLRSLAFKIVPRICDDDQALQALRTAYALRRDRELLQALARRQRRPVVDRYLDWLAEQSGLHDFADLVPLATAAGVHRHLERALSRPSATFWQRLSRFAPTALAEILCGRLRSVPDEPDPPTRQLIDRYTATIVDKAPKAGLVLLELLSSRGIHSHLRALVRAGKLQPRLTLELIERLDLRPENYRNDRNSRPFAPFAHSCEALAENELERIAARDPNLLGEAVKLDERLSPAQLQAVTRGWLTCLKDRPVWGFALLENIDDPGELERAYQRWTVAARDRLGVIPLASVAKLPAALREREARRHLDEIVALRTKPAQRIPYARFLPWDEAQQALDDHLGFPEGEVRGLALGSLLSIPGLRPSQEDLPARALTIVKAKKNEQDPVRMSMLHALVAWPRRIWRPEHAKAIRRIVRDALDAGDLSHGTAVAAETLVVRTFGIDPASAAKSLASLIKERGTIYNARLGEHLQEGELEQAAPHLLEIAKKWAKEERLPYIIGLAESLGERIDRVPGLAELIGELTTKTPWGGLSRQMLELLLRFDNARYASLLPEVVERWTKRGWNQEIIAHSALVRIKGKRQPPPLPILARALETIARGKGRDAEIIQALTILRSRAPRHFDTILGELLELDPSYVCVPVVYWYLHSCRQDLLGPFLELTRIRGRFATGKTAWILPFRRGFYRWTPPQNEAFAACHAKLMNDQERDTPTVWRSLSVYAALDSAPMEALAKMADDPRPAIQERALRVMARCDRGQCVPTLVHCLHDARARIAIYGLRRAMKNILPDRAALLLDDVPLRKVTVAKEVLRLLGELRTQGAYDRLIRFDGSDLHRDVRIALLRALWDHLDRETTWEIFARAVTGEDWVMASRLADIPADRLTQTSDRRLSALLARVLDRPEPEARIGLLRRANHLGIRDPARHFLEACARRLCSPYDDEVRASVRALLVRGTEDDMRAFPGLLRNALADPRSLHVAIASLVGFPLKTRGVWTSTAKAAAQVLADDPRWTSLRIRCEGAIADPTGLLRCLLELADADLLIGDALETARRALASVHVDALEAIVQALMASPKSAGRWLSVGALARDAGPDRGWSPERLARLAILQQDPAAEVSGAALAISPPREMVEVTASDKAASS